MEEIYDVIIIGGGAAGCTAAIYAARRGLKVLLLEAKAIGGLLLYAINIENYPGFELISGAEFASRLEKQVRNLPVELIFENVIDVRKLDKKFKVITSSNKEFESKTIIIASGVEHRELGIKGEEKFVGKGISYCATCDAPFFKDKEVAVVGGGNTAFQYALYLSDLCAKVYLIHRRHGFRAEDTLIDRLRSRKNVEFKIPYVVVDLLGDNLLEGVKLRNLETGEEEILKVPGLFVAIGHKAKVDFLSNLGLELNERGFIKVDERMRTSVEGAFAAGDVTGIEQQLVVACAQGAIAALNAARYLKEGLGWK
ncbi:MAG TPA: thioredoxin-disulfide reductase [Candidatus Aenigmarchaeota archaeon]|nr:thioredoxin-disulfide reductase [Candidatus Aenigmarchaeota archaeon]